MRIYNNFVLNHQPNVYSKNINKSNSKSNHNVYKQTASVCNPQLYKAYYNVSFGKTEKDNSQIPFLLLTYENQKPSKIIGKIPLDSGEIHNLKIDRNIINRFLLSDDGNINQTSLQAFLSAYKTSLQELTKADDEELKFIKGIINGENKSPKTTNVSYLKSNDEAVESLMGALSAPVENFVINFFNGIENEQLRKDYAIKYLSQRDRVLGEKYTKALNRTVCLFDICQTKDGYDFSDLERKTKLVNTIEEIQSSYGDAVPYDLSHSIVEEAKSKKGKIDLDFAETLTGLIYTTSVFMPEKLVSHRSSIIKSFTACDRANEKQIMDCMLKLANIIEVDDTTQIFESALSNVFNPLTGKFDEKAAALLLDLAKQVIDYTDDFPIETKEDLEYTDRLTQSLIDGYFNKVRDKNTGNIIPNCISPKDYIN